MNLFFFFFFKQKTAYEIKECDWSSDVCSSDLLSQAVFAEAAGISESHLAHVLAGRRTSRYVTDLLSNFYGESIEIIPDGQAKINRPSQKAVDLRKILFKPNPKTKETAAVPAGG